MFEEHSMVEEALRVCRKHGGIVAFKSMVFDFCLSFGDDARAMEMLLSYNLYDKAIDYLLNRGLFVRAFEIAEEYDVKEKMDQIRYQYALNLEENGQYEKAESEFVQCRKAKEAIKMYEDRSMYGDAVRVAEQHIPSLVHQL